MNEFDVVEIFWEEWGSSPRRIWIGKATDVVMLETTRRQQNFLSLVNIPSSFTRKKVSWCRIEKWMTMMTSTCLFMQRIKLRLLFYSLSISSSQNKYAFSWVLTQYYRRYDVINLLAQHNKIILFKCFI